VSSRLEKLVHYAIWSVPPEQLGRTKLAKILWFADLEHYRQTGSMLSHSDRYKKRDNGPLHADFYDAIESLEREGKIACRSTQTPVGVRHEYVWLERPDMSDFHGHELATLHEVIDQIRPLSAKEVSELSHVEPWDSAYIGEHLPIAASAVQFGEVTEDDLAWAEREFYADSETS